MADFKLSRRGKSPAATQTQDQNQSLMSQAAGYGASGLHTLGSVLSYPSRLLWSGIGSAAGMKSGPVKLLDSSGSYEAADVLEHLGVLPKNNTEWAWSDVLPDALRLGANVIGDPTSWLGIGGLTRAGVTAAKAGTATRGLTNAIRSGERGLLSFHTPLSRYSAGAVGTGGQVASALENVGRRTGVTQAVQAAGESLPFRIARAQFDARVAGKMHPAIQRHAAHFDEQRRAAQNALDRDILSMATNHANEGLVDPDHGMILRDLVEGMPHHQATPVHQQRAAEMSAVKDAMHAQERALGINIGDLVDDDVTHFPRRISEGVDLPGTQHGFEMAANRVHSRDPVWMNLWGTNNINRLLTDPIVDQAIQGASHLPVGDQIAVATNALRSQFPQHNPDQLAEIAAKMVGVPELRTQGLFGNHPLFDLSSAATASNRRVHSALHAYHAVSDSLHAGPHGTNLAGWLADAGFDPEIAAGHIGQLSGRSAADVLASHIPDDLAQELRTLTPGYRSPPADQAASGLFKSLGAIWKAATLAHPASRVRDFASGIVQNALMGHMTPQGVADARNIVKGLPLGGNYAQLPEVQDLVTRHGLSPDDAVRVILGVEAPRTSLQIADVGHGRVGANLQDILDQIPGRQPSGIREVFGRAARSLRHGELDRAGNPIGDGSVLNPANVAGAFGRETTAFGPVAASNVVSGAGDEFNRHMGVLSQMNQGVSGRASGANTRAAQVDYDPSTFSATERQLRNWFPFYSYTSRMGKHTLGELASNPGGAPAQLLKELDRGAASDPSLPDYITDSTSIPMGTKPDGTKSVLTGLGLMNEASAKMIGQALGGNVKGLGYNVLSQLSPLVRTPIEYTTGQKFFQEGQPLESADPNIGRTLSNIGVGLGLRDEHAGAIRYPGDTAVEQLVGMSPLSRLIGTARSVTDTRKGWDEKALANLTGMKVTDVSPAQQQRTLLKRAEDLAQSHGGKLRSEVYFSKAELDRLKETDPELFAKQKALQQLLNELRAKMKKDKKSTGGIRLSRAS